MGRGDEALSERAGRPGECGHPAPYRAGVGLSGREDGLFLREGSRPGVLLSRLVCAAALLLAALGVDAGHGMDAQMPESQFEVLRQRMVREQIRRRGVEDPAVLAAMERVPRHLFVPDGFRADAYLDHPLPIGHGQTISQPYIVALMTELLELDRGQKVLEIGTGSGYQAAVLAELGASVYTIEIRDELGRQAGDLLARLGYDNVRVRVGNGYHGWPEEAPFDAIIVTASPPEIPDALVQQLKVGGRMVVPVGAGGVQDLELLTKTEDGVLSRDIIPVRFVPMIGGDRDE